MRRWDELPGWSNWMGSDVSRRPDDHESSFHLVVSDGLVSCPRRGPTDVLECFVCGYGRGLVGDPNERVLCAWDPWNTADDATGEHTRTDQAHSGT